MAAMRIKNPYPTAANARARENITARTSYNPNNSHPAKGKMKAMTSHSRLNTIIAFNPVAAFLMSMSDGAFENIIVIAKNATIQKIGLMTVSCEKVYRNR